MQTRPRFHSAIAAVMLLTAIAGRAQERPSSHATEPPTAPEITVFDAPGAGTTGLCYPECGTYPLDINAEGAVTGYIIGNDYVIHAFLRERGGSIETFDFPGAAQSLLEGTYGIGINDEGTIVGAYNDENGGRHGFLRERGGRFLSFDVPAGVGNTNPVSISDSGAVAGNYGGHGFLRDRDGKYHGFDPPGSISTATEWMSESEEITGVYQDAGNHFHGFLRKRDGKIVTFDPPESTYTLPRGVNSEGTVTGYYSTPEGQYGFLRTPDGKEIVIVPPDTFSVAPAAISDDGTITGSAGVSFGPDPAFTRDRDGNYVTFFAQYGGMDSTTAPLAINRNGAITGYVIDSNNVNHAFIRAAPETGKHCERDDRK
jgi:hypothetical protein